MISLGNCYDVLGEYEMADYYLRLLYEYFTADIEKMGLYGRINIFQNLVVIYSSMLGNKGSHSESNHVAVNNIRNAAEEIVLKELVYI